MESINKLFEYRHIFAHEFALNVHTDIKIQLEDFERLDYFLTCSNYVIAVILEENLGVGTYETQEIAFSQFKKAELRLNKLIRSIKTIKPGLHGSIGDKSLFNTAIREWKKYRECYAQAVTASYEGGTISAFIFWSELEHLTLQMEANLTESWRKQLETSIIGHKR